VTSGGRQSAARLDELYKRAGYLITPDAPHHPGEKKFGQGRDQIPRGSARRIFRKTAHTSTAARPNRTEADYDETWETDRWRPHSRENLPPHRGEVQRRAKEMYVTYDLEQKTRGVRQRRLSKIKRVYIAADVKDWKVGTFARNRPGCP